MPRTTKQVTTAPSSTRGYMPVSQTDDWATPLWLYLALHLEFNFTLDAAASVENAQCERFFTKEMDALTQDWGRHTVYCNPPYGRVINDWMAKALDASRRGATVVMLVPGRTDASWMHEVALPRASEVILLRGRVKFGGCKDSAPFPSIIVVFRPADSRKIGPRLAAVSQG
jgi:phage N-6-adenine-methyltransferase